MKITERMKVYAVMEAESSPFHSDVLCAVFASKNDARVWIEDRMKDMWDDIRWQWRDDRCDDEIGSVSYYIEAYNTETGEIVED